MRLRLLPPSAWEIMSPPFTRVVKLPCTSDTPLLVVISSITVVMGLIGLSRSGTIRSWLIVGSTTSSSSYIRSWTPSVIPSSPSAITTTAVATTATAIKAGADATPNTPAERTANTLATREKKEVIPTASPVEMSSFPVLSEFSAIFLPIL